MTKRRITVTHPDGLATVEVVDAGESMFIRLTDKEGIQRVILPLWIEAMDEIASKWLDRKSTTTA